MKKNILGVFTLALLVLMGTGVAFGHWQDWVYVNGYVNTGYIDVVPSYESDYYSAFNQKTAEYAVATSDCSVKGDTLFINLYNVYPAVCWYGWFNIENLGTVPAGFAGITAMSSDPGLKLVEQGYLYWDVYYDNGTAWVGPIATLEIVQSYTGSPSTMCQIDPGEENALFFSVNICFMNPLPQSTTFQFDLTLEFWNWNEAPCCIQLS
jgi:hypothetical protein